MSYPDKFKQGFINLIENELNKCEIIYNPNTKGIWFVNREEKYWYLEYKVETNYLWWRYDFFKSYMELFSMSSEVFQELISEWVENKLNAKVGRTELHNLDENTAVEETLNCKVLTTGFGKSSFPAEVGQTLNCKVLTTKMCILTEDMEVEDTLNLKVDKIQSRWENFGVRVEDTLNLKVLATKTNFLSMKKSVEDTLNLK